MYGNTVRNPHQKRVQDENLKGTRFKINSDTLSAKSQRNEIEPDPELLEEYDNFYQTTKSLLVLFQIMGVMPIERPTKGKTTFR